jgi:hypothetical protein
MLGGPHVWLRQQDEMTNALLPGALDSGPEQRSSRASALAFREDGQGPDLGLVPAGDHLAALRPALEHDGPEDPAVVLTVDGHQDRAVSLVAKSAKHRRVAGIRRHVTACLVGGHPDLADLGQLGRQSVSNDHGLL